MSTELSERETYIIGLIVSQWGFLESEIFEQTFLSFEDDDDLPPAMKKNAKFSQVLELWLKRVAEVQEPAKKSVLKTQYHKIKSLNKFRQAVVHSRWEWKPDTPEEITAIRAHNQSIKCVKFTFEDLFEFATTLGEIRYSVRYPGGLEDRADEMKERRGHISRLGWDLLAGRVTLDDLAKHGKET